MPFLRAERLNAISAAKRNDVIPAIETQRLRLRPHCENDLPACVAMWSDATVTRFITGRASSEQQTWARLLSYLGHWALKGFGYWAIEEKHSREFVGEIGFADFKRGIENWPDGSPELGFALLPRFHGRGYATEAVAAALCWADENLDCDRTVCLVNAQNVPSLHIAGKTGYSVLEGSTYNEQPVLFCSRARRPRDRS